MQVSLTLVDFTPTILYIAGGWFVVCIMRMMGKRELSLMFMAGVTLAAISGILKALSKLIDALANQPVTKSGFMYDQMFPVMATGFLATTTAIILKARGFSGRDKQGERTVMTANMAWFSPSVAGLFLGFACAIVIAKNGGAQFLKPMLTENKRWSMVSMIVFQFATIGILAMFAFNKKVITGGVFAIISILFMLAMGSLGSPSASEQFTNRILLNWID